MSDQAQKSFLFKLLVTAGTIILSIGICAFGYTKYQDYREQQKVEAHKAAQNAIHDMVNLCGFHHISTEEQAAIDKTGDDVEAARRILANIVDDRIVYWENHRDDVTNKLNKLNDIRKNAPYWSYGNESEYKGLVRDLAVEGIKSLGELKAWNEAREKLKNFIPGAKPEDKGGKPSKADNKTII